MITLQNQLNKFDYLFDMIDRIVQIAIVFAFIVLFGMLNIQVAMRYVFRIPLIWIEELAGFLLAFLTLWGSSSCIRTDSHIRVSFIVKYIKSMRWRCAFAIGVHLLILIYLYYLTVYGYQFALIGKGEITPSGTFDFFLPRLSLATGGVLMIIQTVGIIIREFSRMIAHPDIYSNSQPKSE